MSEGRMMKLKREFFHTEIKRKERERLFNEKRLYGLHRHFGPDQNEENYDLNALHNAQLNEVDIPHLQTEIIDYLLALKENETEKSIECLVKLKYLTHKYLMMESEVNKSRSSYMDHLYLFFNEKKLNQYLLSKCTPAYSERIDTVEMVQNILCLINYLIMGTKGAPDLISRQGLLPLLFDLMHSKFPIIVDSSLLILGNLIIEQSVAMLQIVFCHEGLIPALQTVVSMTSPPIRSQLCFCIESMCNTLSVNWLFFQNSQLVPHLLTFINALVPNHQVLNGFYELISGKHMQEQQLLEIVQTFEGLLMRIVAQLECISPTRKNDAASINATLNVLNYLASIDNELIARQLMQLNLIKAISYILQNIQEPFILENTTHLIQNLACAHASEEQIGKYLLKELFQLFRTSTLYRVRKNVAAAIANFVQVCDCQYLNYTISLGLEGVLESLLRDYSDANIVLKGLDSLSVYSNHLQEQRDTSFEDPLNKNTLLKFKAILEQVLQNTHNHEIELMVEKVLRVYFLQI